MDLISLLLWLGLAALAVLPVAALSGWLVGPGQRSLGPLIQGHESWWRSTMPWPRGIQEEDGVAWHVAASPPSAVAPGPSGPPSEEAAKPDECHQETTRLEPSVRLRIR
jgi:hypothetical protein